MSDWQPIETAPRNGEEILVAFGGFDSVCPLVMAWNELYEEWEIPACGICVQDKPTHWMPLPEPPQPHPSEAVQQ